MCRVSARLWHRQYLLGLFYPQVIIIKTALVLPVFYFKKHALYKAWEHFSFFKNRPLPLPVSFFSTDLSTIIRSEYLDETVSMWHALLVFYLLIIRILL
jgi:hypothetical protein